MADYVLPVALTNGELVALSSLATERRGGDEDVPLGQLINGILGRLAASAHAASHLPSGEDPLPVGTTAETFVVGNDPRVVNAIDAQTHARLRQLIHFIDEGPASGFATGAFKETIGGVFPTSVTWYEDATKTKKIVEKVITRNGGGATPTQPTPIVWTVFAADGVTPVGIISDSITYVNVFEASRVRTVVL